MLAKKYRLPIQTVLNKSGRNFKGRCFLFKFFLNKSRSASSGQVNFNRFGVVIGKKIDKRAAERNRLKRIIFDSVKKFVYQMADAENKSRAFPENPAVLAQGKAQQPFSQGSILRGKARDKENFDVLIIVLQNMTKLKKADIIKELDESLQKFFNLKLKT